MNILFDNNTNYDFNKEKTDIIKAAAAETLKYENFPNNVEISVSIVTDDEIQKLNSEFRNIDKPTDVLSFPMINFEKGEKPSFLETEILGDIVISIERAEVQAKEYGHSIDRELGFLTVHSMLHLLGYDHMTPDDEKIMFKKQEEILNNINLRRS